MKSKTVNPTNYKAVVDALKELGVGEDLKKIPSSIGSSERRMYHVVLLSVRLIPGSVKNEVKITVSKYHRRGFEKIEDNFTNHADKIFVLHNPEDMDEKEETIIPAYEAAKTEEEIRKEVKDEMEDEVKKRVDEALKKQREEIELASYKDKPKLDVSGLAESDTTVEVMRNFSKENNLNLKGAKTKEEVISALVKAVAEHNAKIDAANAKK